MGIRSVPFCSKKSRQAREIRIMAKKQKGVFEADRKMELRLRLAAKRAAQNKLPAEYKPLAVEIPEQDTVSKLISKVQAL
jgi:hypothetical protein